MVPFWAAALRRVQRAFHARQVPLLALGAAFSFLIMMFNVPIPGGTTGHAVGSVLVAILLGPWAACLAVSLALTVQAFMFGDGGVTALGANALNMAVIMPFVGWWAYQFLAGNRPVMSRRRVAAAGVAGYLGLNVAALSTAFMFGIQPAIAQDASGRALYCPYGLNVAIPVMGLEHLLFFGFVEAVATALVVAYVRRGDPMLLQAAPPISPTARRLAWGVLALVMLCPLGLWLPEKLGAGDAWGEWSVENLAARIGYTPGRMQKLAALWKAPMPDYALRGQEEAAVSRLGVSYVLSAVVGVLLLTACVGLLRARSIGRRDAEANT